jgi:hypothetical protein
MLHLLKKMKRKQGKKYTPRVRYEVFEVTPAPVPVLEMCEICGGRLPREHIEEHRARCVLPDKPAARRLTIPSKPSKSCHCGGMNETCTFCGGTGSRSSASRVPTSKIGLQNGDGTLGKSSFAKNARSLENKHVVQPPTRTTNSTTPGAARASKKAVARPKGRKQSRGVSAKSKTGQSRAVRPPIAQTAQTNARESKASRLSAKGKRFKAKGIVTNPALRDALRNWIKDRDPD